MEYLSIVFKMANLVAAASWLGLIFFPKANPTKWLIRSGLVSACFSLLYVFFLVPALFSGAEGGFRSLEGVAQLFRNQDWVLVGWIHYLPFDLLVGVWILGDSERRGWKQWQVSPILLLTFVFGPAGFGVYYFLKKWKKRDLQELYSR